MFSTSRLRLKFLQIIFHRLYLLGLGPTYLSFFGVSPDQYSHLKETEKHFPTISISVLLCRALYIVCVVLGFIFVSPETLYFSACKYRCPNYYQTLVHKCNNCLLEHTERYINSVTTIIKVN